MVSILPKLLSTIKYIMSHILDLSSMECFGLGAPEITNDKFWHFCLSKNNTVLKYSNFKLKQDSKKIRSYYVQNILNYLFFKDSIEVIDKELSTVVYIVF